MPFQCSTNAPSRSMLGSRAATGLLQQRPEPAQHDGGRAGAPGRRRRSGGGGGAAREAGGPAARSAGSRRGPAGRGARGAAAGGAFQPRALGARGRERATLGAGEWDREVLREERGGVRVPWVSGRHPLSNPAATGHVGLSSPERARPPGDVPSVKCTPILET
nr:translation initiation factor IF-2-like [Equus asinus]